MGSRTSTAGLNVARERIGVKANALGWETLVRYSANSTTSRNTSSEIAVVTR